LSTESVGSRRQLVANCVHTADADTTKQFRRVGGVYRALENAFVSCRLCIYICFLRLCHTCALPLPTHPNGSLPLDPPGGLLFPIPCAHPDSKNPNSGYASDFNAFLVADCQGQQKMENIRMYNCSW